MVRAVTTRVGLVSISVVIAACGGDAHRMHASLDLLTGACDDARLCGDHLEGTGVVAKTGDSTSDGFITGSDQPLIHIEAGLTGPWSGKALPPRADGDPSPSGSHPILIIEFAIPGSTVPQIRYHELTDGHLTFEANETHLAGQLTALDGDWSHGGSFSFDAVETKENGDVVRFIRNGVLESLDGAHRVPTPNAPIFQRAQLAHGGERRSGEGGDVYITIENVTRAFADDWVPPEAGTDPGPIEGPGVAPPSSTPGGGSTASPGFVPGGEANVNSSNGSSEPTPSSGGESSGSSGSSGSSASSDSGGGCGGSSSDTSSSDSGSSCGGSSSDSSSCGGSSSDSSSCGSSGGGSGGSSCGGGGGGCEGDASPRTARAAGATVRFVWPIGVVGMFNRFLRATLRRRRRSPSASRGSHALDDRR